MTYQKIAGCLCHNPHGGVTTQDALNDLLVVEDAPSSLRMGGGTGVKHLMHRITKALAHGMERSVIL